MSIVNRKIVLQHVEEAGVALALHQRLRLEKGFDGALIVPHDLQREALLDQDASRRASRRRTASSSKSRASPNRR